MKYIGNKTRLLDFIAASMEEARLPKQGTFIDIFGGTGSVGSFFKRSNEVRAIQCMCICSFFEIWIGTFRTSGIRVPCNGHGKYYSSGAGRFCH